MQTILSKTKNPSRTRLVYANHTGRLLLAFSSFGKCFRVWWDAANTGVQSQIIEKLIWSFSLSARCNLWTFFRVRVSKIQYLNRALSKSFGETTPDQTDCYWNISISSWRKPTGGVIVCTRWFPRWRGLFIGRNTYLSELSKTVPPKTLETR